MATLTLLRKIFLQTSLLAALVASQDVSGSYSTIKSPDGIQVRYKQPNICETTHGVQSYSGYVDLASDAHMFFWLFEARHSPASAPTTIWLSGGPGSDSLLATFIENGPCNITSATNLTTNNNPYSWNNNSNVIYISQPIGVGFSYGEKAPGSLNADTGVYETTPVNGVWPVNATNIDTTDLAAEGTWQAIQALYSTVSHFANWTQTRTLNLFTESYGGHYGPVFMNYFAEKNDAIAKGQSKGSQLKLGSLGIGNGVIDMLVQAPYFAEFAVHNTYGIQTINETVYDHMQFALNELGYGCLDQIALCRESDGANTPTGKAICAEATDACRDGVEGPFFAYSTRDSYDIRYGAEEAIPPTRQLKNYLNQASIQKALGVDLNWTATNVDVNYAFTHSGDYIYSNPIEDIGALLDRGIRVTMYHGDADFNGNWFGGEAVSLAVNYTNAGKFKSAGYAPFTINGKEYGSVRQYGNFSFLRVYDSGHQVPYFQPLAALELFERTIFGLDIATGKVPVSADYHTTGPANSTHTESSVLLR